MNKLHAEKYVKNPNCKWLVLLHGFAGSANMWKKQTEILKNYYNLLIIDLPGHGKSKEYLHSKYFHSFTEIGDLIVDKMNEEHVYKATFLCLSLGSLVFAGILKNHSEVIESAILCGAVAGVSKLVEMFIKIVYNFIQFIPYNFLMKVACLTLLPKHSHKVIRRLFERSARKMGDVEFKAWCHLLVKDLKVLKILKGIKKEILFISGDEDYMFLTGVKRKAAQLLNSKFEIIKNCSHVCNIQKANEVNQMVLKWMNRDLQLV